MYFREYLKGETIFVLKGEMALWASVSDGTLGFYTFSITLHLNCLLIVKVPNISQTFRSCDGKKWLKLALSFQSLPLGAVMQFAPVDIVAFYTLKLWDFWFSRLSHWWMMITSRSIFTH